MIGKGTNKPSIARQSQRLGLSRSCFYRRRKAGKTDDLSPMQLRDEQLLRTPFPTAASG